MSAASWRVLTRSNTSSLLSVARFSPVTTEACFAHVPRGSPLGTSTHVCATGHRPGGRGVAYELGMCAHAWPFGWSPFAVCFWTCSVPPGRRERVPACRTKPLLEGGRALARQPSEGGQARWVKEASPGWIQGECQLVST